MAVVPDVECLDCGLRARSTPCGVCFVRRLRQRSFATLAGVLEALRARHVCAYCGESATDREHVLPKVAGGDFTVPSCRECNILAGSKIHLSFEERRAYIRARIEKRYRRLLRQPEWSRDEVSELGRALSDVVVASEAARRIIVDRLAFSAEISFIKDEK